MARVTATGGRTATTRHIPPKLALAVGMPATPAPKGWKWSALTDLARLESGHTPSRNHPEYWGGSIPWLGIRDARAHDGRRIDETEETINKLGIENSSARLLPAGTVCLSRTASVGYVVVMGRPMATSQDFVNWVCSKDLDPGFLKYLLIAEGDGLLRFASGSVHQTIYFPEVKAFHICHPPRPEQQRIVALLDEAFAGIAIAKANAERNLQNARALFESHLQAVFTRRGDGWVDRQLASLCREIAVGYVGPMKTQYKENGVPFLRSQNIRPFEVSMDNSMFIDEVFHRALKKSQLRPGDLAIVRTGYPGTAAVIPTELPDSNCSDLVIARPSKEIDPHFLAAFFNSSFGKQLVLGKSVGAAQKHFNITTAREVMLHVPPMPEQRSIVARVRALRAETQHLVQLYGRKLASLRALERSLLHQAFVGELH
ncbi:MAG: restriction endonuclease subunit S [Holophagales bacterium]|nr:MAG: restriction endonuclease subunit S [Holophagales bacterium]